MIRGDRMTCDIYGDVCCFGICDCPHEDNGCETKVKEVMRCYHITLEDLIAKEYDVNIDDVKELLMEL